MDRLLHCIRLADNVPIWRIRTKTPIVARPLLTPSAVYFASRDGTIHACTPGQKTKVWTVELGTQVTAKMRLDDARLLVPGVDGSLYCLDAASGQLGWRFRTPGQLRTPPATAGNTVYQYSQDHGLYAIDMDTGRQLWQRPAGLQFLAQDGSVAYVLNGLQEIVGIDSDGAREVACVQAGRVELAATSPQGPSIFLASRRGQLICVRPASHPYLRRKQVSAAWQSSPAATAGAEPGEMKAGTSATGPAEAFDPLRSDDKTPAVAGYGLASPPTPGR
jgi:hypothetical protein